MIDLAKHQLDLGMLTLTRNEMLRFWQDEIGLVSEGVLSVGGGVQQHRHVLRGSIIKINHARDHVDPEPPSGYRRLIVARPGVTSQTDLTDPDGNEVSLVPPGTDGITQLAVEMGVRDPAAHLVFFTDIVGLTAQPRSAVPAVRVGDSVLRFVVDPDAPSDATRRGTGWRYCTLQVWDADAEHQRCIAAGARDGHAPFTHGDVARYGFIRDPDGNWIELSQRASLTGPLPRG